MNFMNVYLFALTSRIFSKSNATFTTSKPTLPLKRTCKRIYVKVNVNARFQVPYSQFLCS